MPRGVYDRATKEHYCDYCMLSLKLTESAWTRHVDKHRRLNHRLKPAQSQPLADTVATTPVLALPTATSTNPLACAECAASGVEKIFNKKHALNSHRSRAHGVRSPNYQYYLNRKNKNRSIIHTGEAVHANGNGKSIDNNVPANEYATIYAAGYVKSRIDSFAESGNLSSSILTQGVCQLLLDSAGGQAVRPEVPVPHVRRHTA